jgi:hypothetical protein
VRLRFETNPDDVDGKCPIAIDVLADYAEVVAESDEGNNTATTCCEP